MILYLILYQVNYDKAKLYRIGSLANSDAKIYTIKEFTWTKEPIDILGILISNDIEHITELNYKQILIKVENVLQLWIHRGLLRTGKILVVNSLVASLFVYKMSVLPNIPRKHTDKFYEIVRNFLWKLDTPRLA